MSWVPVNERLTDGRGVRRYDELFHETLVAATGNLEMARIHHDITERIRIIRRLDFTKEARIDASKAEVRKITLHMLHTARPAHAA